MTEEAQVNMGAILARWKNFPSEIYWELTYNCNLRCIYCYNSCPKEVDQELSSWQKRKLARKLLYEQPSKVCFTGGEPTLHKGFLSLVEIFHKNCHHPGLITNGYGISEENVNRYLDYFSSIKISLDTLDPGEAALINRNREAPAVATRAIDLLLDEGYDPRNLAVVGQLTDYQSLGNYQGLLDYVGARKIGTFQGGPSAPYGRATKQDFTMSQRRMERLNSMIDEAKKKYPNTNFEVRCVPAEFSKEVDLLKFIVENAWITPSGSLKSCFFPFIFGNALRGRLDELFGSYYRYGVYSWISKSACETSLSLEERTQKKYRQFHPPKVEMETAYIIVTTGRLWGGGPHGMGFMSPGGPLTWDEALFMNFRYRSVNDVIHIGEGLGYEEGEVRRIIKGLKMKKVIKLRKARRAKTDGLTEKLKKEIEAVKKSRGAAA